ncbi:hypothetical protein ACIA5E_00325 [Nocardia asteroides]|uniref:hypothetical protein n=1 Tax=Nocardia asteroides TaxID=1824 RepID=UPI0037B68B87
MDASERIQHINSLLAVHRGCIPKRGGTGRDGCHEKWRLTELSKSERETKDVVSTAPAGTLLRGDRIVRHIKVEMPPDQPAEQG